MEPSRSGQGLNRIIPIKNGFEFGHFDFTVLRQRANHVIDGKPLPPHLRG
jgi:hypothetical protein